MSRRFGRNQKRHMRDLLAHAEQRAASLDEARRRELGLLRSTSDQLATHKQFFADIARKVGQHAIIAGIEPRFMQNMPTEPQWRMPVTQPMPSFVSFEHASMPDRMTIHDEMMELLEVDAVRDQFSDKLHVRGVLADGRVGYSISRAALRDMTVDELVRQITPELARALVTAIKKA